MYRFVLIALLASCICVFGDAGNFLTPENWKETVPGKVRIKEDNGKLNVSISGSGAAVRYFPLNPEWKGLIFRFVLWTEEVVRGKLDWQTAKLEILFFDRNNRQVGGWPPFATAYGNSQKRHELFYRIPAGATTVRITPANMGVSGKVDFLDMTVAPVTGNRITNLDAAPPEGTVESIMNLEGAERWKTGSRERICLNGLWQFFPLKAGSPAKEFPRDGSGWCWFKVPGAWPENGMDTAGNSQEIIASPYAEKTDPLKLNEAWYRRIFTVPADWSGKKLILTFTMLQTRAKVLIDRQEAGEIDFPGGELDLTGKLIPGRRQEVAILVSANPEKNGSLFMAPDVVVKVSGRLPFRGITGDLYLEALPQESSLSDVHIIPSVRQKTITFDAGIRDAAPGNYRLKAIVFDGDRAVREFSSSFRIPDAAVRLRRQFTFSWENPKLWDTDRPENLYRAEISLERDGNNERDTLFPEEFGFREFWKEGRNFYLNGSIIHLRSMAVACARNGAFEAHREGVRNVLRRIKEANFNAIYGLDYSFKPGIVGYIDNVYEESSRLGLLSALTLPHAAQYDWNLDDPKKRALYRQHAEHLIRRFQNLPGVVLYTMNHNAVGHIADQNPLKIGMPGDPDLDNEQRLQALKAEKLVNALDPERVVYHHAGSPGNSVYAANFYLCWAPIQERSDWFEHWEKHGTRPLMLSEWGIPHTASYSSYRNGSMIWHKNVNQWFLPEEYHAEFLGPEAYRLTREDKALLDSQTRNLGNKPISFWWGFCYPFRPARPLLNEFVRENFRAFRIRGISWIAPWDYQWFWEKTDDLQNYQINLNAYRNLKRRGCVPDYFASSGHKTHGFRPDRDGHGTFRLTDMGKIVAACFADYLGFIAGKEGDFSEKGHNFARGELVSKQLIVANDSRRTGTAVCRARIPELEIVLEKKLELATGTTGSVPVEFRIPENYPRDSITIQAEFRFPDGTGSKDSFRVDVIPSEEPVSLSSLGIYDPEGTAETLLKEAGTTAFRRIRSKKDLKNVTMLIIGRRGMKHLPFSLTEEIERGLKVLVLEQEMDDLQRMGFRVNVQGLRQVFSLAPDFRPQRWWRGSSTLTGRYLNLPKLETLYPVWSFNGLFVNHNWRAGNRGNVSSVLIEKPPVGNFRPLMEGGFDLQYAPVLEMFAGKGYILYSQMDLSGRSEQDPEAANTFRRLLRRLNGAQAFASRPVLYLGDSRGRKLLDSLQIRYTEDRNAVKGDTLLVLGPGSRPEDFKRLLENGADLLLLAPERESLAALLKPEELPVPGRHFPDSVNGLADHPEFSGISNADLHWRSPIPLSFHPEGDGGRALRVFRIGKGRLVVSLVAPWQFDAGERQYRSTIRRTTFLMSRLLHNLRAADRVRPLMFDPDFRARNVELADGWLGREDPAKTGRENGWHKGSFPSDRKWRKTRVNGVFEAQFDDLKNYNGWFWYRRTFDMPRKADLNGEYVLNIPAVDDESWCWINGKFIGSVTQKSNPENYWVQRRFHPFPGKILKRTGNQLVILCNDLQMSGGIWGIPTIRKLRETFSFYTDEPIQADDPYRYCRW